MTDAPAPYALTAPLTVAVDVRSPSAYLALAPTWALIEELAVEAEWLPVEGAPMRPPPAGGPERGTRHRIARAEYEAADIARYAADRGLVIRKLYRTPDGSRAGAGLLAARACSRAALRTYLDALFSGYWSDQLDIESAETIERVLADSGVPAPDWTSLCAEYAALQPGLAALGVFSAPAYIVGGEIYLGRAHLPMVRWQLTGRRGPAPI